MPHVVENLVPGNSEEQQTRLAEQIAEDVMDILNYGDKSLSVAVEEVEPQDWAEKVYKPEIQGKWNTLYKKPGYNPLED